jgi:hypothetical protein
MARLSIGKEKAPKWQTHQFENNKEHVVEDKGPLAAVTIGCNTKDDGADGTEHEDESDAPGDVGLGLAKLFAQLGDGEGDGEEVEGVYRGLARVSSKLA